MRCRACNAILSSDELKCTDDDWEYCNECKIRSNEEFDITDIEFVQGTLTGVSMDGSAISIDTTYLSCLDDGELHF